MLRPWLAGLAAALLPGVALAHSFGRLYTLPVPVWMYLYGAAAALLLSFLVIGYFVGTPQAAQRNYATRPLPPWCERLFAPGVVMALQGLSVALLLLCIATGLFGTRNSYANFNMTWFWVVFVLGYTYLVALSGDSYARLNPWRTLLAAGGRLFAGRRPYPARLGYWPALALYAAFIWIELFGGTRPWSLAWLLLGYSAISAAGAWWWGREAWFRYGDFLAVFFRIVGLMAPLARSDGRLRLRQPFIGLMQERCESLGLLLFVLFMLSSTAFDGLHETVPWVRLYWRDVLSLLKPLVGDDIVVTFPYFKKLYALWQTAALLLSPLLYLALYVAMVALARWLARSRIALRTLCLEFGYTLVPIAFVYHVTHYYTLLQSQGPRIIELASDPFGLGWNLFGTRGLLPPILPDAGTVWHTQVALILGGHIVSVYLAHLVALRVFDTPRAALLSQLPMLLLMVLYTTAGLWILSLPIQAGMYVP